MKLFLGRSTVAVDDVVAHRHIQHARRDDLVQLLAQQPAVAVEALLMKRVQVNDELHVQSVPDIGQRERLFTALVVHDAQVQPPVANIAVYTVHLAGKRNRHAVLLAGDGRQVAAAREIHLVVDRMELRHAQLLDDVVQDLLHALDQPPEQITEARRLVCQTAKLLPDVLIDCLAACTRDRVLFCGGSAALALSERCQRVLEHIMDERAGLGRGKRRRAAHLRLEAILIKERARAGEELIHARGGQIELLAVQTLDGRRFRQRTARAALSCRREHPLVILIKGIGRRDRRCAVAREIRARKLDRRPLRL